VTLASKARVKKEDQKRVSEFFTRTSQRKPYSNSATIEVTSATYNDSAT